MNYAQGVTKMKNLANQSGSFEPFNGIIVNYPGYKKSGDYKVSLADGEVPTHADMANLLHDLITSEKYTYEELKDFLIDVYQNGTTTNYNNSSLEELKHKIFWITLQEEINYPRSTGKAGINLPYCRYYEAIYCTRPESNFELSEVKNRCNHAGKNKPVLYSIPDAPLFYKYN